MGRAAFPVKEETELAAAVNLEDVEEGGSAEEVEAEEVEAEDFSAEAKKAEGEGAEAGTGSS